ncbi:hypothetical protein QQ045_003064 [Rhodiola kirilowii]
MADQPIHRADFERVTANLTASLAALTNQMAELATRVNQNGGGEGAQREVPVRVPRVERVRAVATEDSSSGEEDPMDVGRDEEENRYDSNYRVKVDIPLFHGTMGVEEFLDWQIDVDRFLDVLGVPESKQAKMVAIRLKDIAAVWWDKLVVQRRRQGNARAYPKLDADEAADVGPILAR